MLFPDALKYFLLLLLLLFIFQSPFNETNNRNAIGSRTLGFGVCISISGSSQFRVKIFWLRSFNVAVN